MIRTAFFIFFLLVVLTAFVQYGIGAALLVSVGGLLAVLAEIADNITVTIK